MKNIVILDYSEYQEMQDKLEGLQEELNKLKPIHKPMKEIVEQRMVEYIVKFFKANEVGCDETITQADRIRDLHESFMIDLFNVSKELFLVGCGDCGGRFLEKEVQKCRACGECFCLDDCAEDQFDETPYCEWCRDHEK